MLLPLGQSKQTLWRWFAVLLLANGLDLLFTYIALERGFREWNPLLQPIILTLWPVLAKGATFVALAWCLARIVRLPPAHRRVLPVLQTATVAYMAVIAYHVLGLVSRSG